MKAWLYPKQIWSCYTQAPGMSLSCHDPDYPRWSEAKVWRPSTCSKGIILCIEIQRKQSPIPTPVHIHLHGPTKSQWALFTSVLTTQLFRGGSPWAREASISWVTWKKGERQKKWAMKTRQRRQARMRGFKVDLRLTGNRTNIMLTPPQKNRGGGGEII